MPAYIDGFVLPVPTKNLAAYRRIARVAEKDAHVRRRPRVYREE